MKHICAVCGNEVDRDSVLAAIAIYPYQISEDEVDAYHLDCAVSDGSWIKSEDELEPEEVAIGVYLKEA